MSCHVLQHCGHNVYVGVNLDVTLLGHPVSNGIIGLAGDNP